MEAANRTEPTELATELASGVKRLSVHGAAQLQCCRSETIIRWITRGKMISSGETVYLEAVPWGRGYATTAAAIARFHSRTQVNTADPTTGPTMRTVTEKQRAIKKAAESLGV